jgi:hypothetical protein
MNMKDALINAPTKALLIVTLITSLNAMETEKLVPNITFVFHNQTTKPLKLSIPKPEHANRVAAIPENDFYEYTPSTNDWFKVIANTPLLSLPIEQETQERFINIYFTSQTQELVVAGKKRFQINPHSSYKLPLTITPANVEVGELELRYRTLELPQTLTPKKIVIKGREIQLPPKEVINARAPELQRLIE